MDLSYLEGRPYDPGRQHCLTLVAEFYREVMGLNPRNYANPEGWPLQPDFDLIAEGLEAEGFELINGGLNSCRFGYLLALDIYHVGRINHLAVYVGQNKVLHQSRNRVSVIEEISPVMRRLVRGMYRPPNYEQWCESRSSLLLETLPLYQQQRLVKAQEISND
ncbi:NlpC/P60 family protein [Oceanimonas pelagia]|uniref:NlpC/P60 family protein n=1 Tax=Oceanimonas pelagia TaxID=3028314 RepID=A0AA50QAS9_9GAMM|nr:hypothetical protein [Oceanimonas pelagia]WMC09502.1 NlpC/P60 family protein [Oceanimonas pelagia]